MKTQYSYLIPIIILIAGCLAKKELNGSFEQKVLNKKSEVEIVLDSILNLAKENSVYTKKVDWGKLEKDVQSKLINTDSIEAIIEPIEYLLTELRDFHGFVMINGLRYGGNVQREKTVKYEMDHKIASRLFQESRGGNYKIEGLLLDNTIAYLKIPSININADEEKIENATKEIREVVCELINNNPKAWVIDLRTNIGGNMYPMISGIGNLLPNLNLGGDSKDGITYNSKWELIDGNLHMWNSPMTDIPLNCKFKNKPQIAVLISRYTASSGEAVASSLKGQENIKLFGEKSSGYSSVNAWYPINDTVIFGPATAYYMSIDKSFHEDGIIPDYEIIEELNLDELLKGQVIDKAKEWLNTNKK